MLNEADSELKEKFYLPDICTAQSLFFMVLAGVLLSIVFALLSGEIQTFKWGDFAIIAFLVLWIILLSGAILCQLRPLLLELSLKLGLLASYVVIIAVTGSVSLLGQWLNIEYLGAFSTIDFWITLEHVIIAGILAGVALRYLYLQQQLHMQEQAELAARIQALQSRIRPHFLFNSMNIIASLIESDPDLAEEVVEDLADLFRATLSEASQRVSLNKEIELLQKYIHIEHLRMGDRLQVDWQLDVFDDSVLIPQLSLQPLLENAIYHGIQPLAKGGLITVIITERDDFLHVTIRNPCDKKSTALAEQRLKNKSGNQLALDNFRRRLQAYYQGQATLSIEEIDQQFILSFSYPLQMKAQ